MGRRSFFVTLTCWLFAACASSSSYEGQEVLKSETVANTKVTAHLSGTAFVTHDLEASIAFYESFLNYRVFRRATLNTGPNLSVWGTTEGPVQYVAMVPHDFSNDNPHPGLNFAQIEVATPEGNKLKADRRPQEGEAIFAYEVTGLEEIATKARDGKIPIVAPLALSATGKSQTLTLLDPNGLRIQLYEYVPGV